MSRKILETIIDAWPITTRKARRFRGRERGERFDNIMQMAGEVADRNPTALHDLVNLLLRPYQSEALVGVVERAAHQAPSTIVSAKFFFDDQKAAPVSYEVGVRLEPNAFKVNLAKDAILPSPWHRQRIASALAHIGPGKTLGHWRQDSNHQVILWLPWGISFVGGGNHSICAGVIAGEGYVTPGEVYDMSNLLDMVRCDGRYFRKSDSQKVVAEVSDERIAAVFEIGRLMRQLGVQPNIREACREFPQSA